MTARPRDSMFTFRITPTMRRAIVRKAQQLGISVSELVRRAAAAKLAASRRTPEPK